VPHAFRARAPTFLAPLVREPRSTHRLINRRTGAVVATTVEPAFDSKTRKKGLLGRDAMAKGSALVIAPCSSIHMFFMRFPIDAVFVARDGRVLKVVPHLRPWRIAMSPRAFAVVELPAGEAGNSDTQAGDYFDLSSADRPA
jgi:hypothetical protein